MVCGFFYFVDSLVCEESVLITKCVSYDWAVSVYSWVRSTQKFRKNCANINDSIVPRVVNIYDVFWHITKTMNSK